MLLVAVELDEEVLAAATRPSVPGAPTRALPASQKQRPLTSVGCRGPLVLHATHVRLLQLAQPTSSLAHDLAALLLVVVVVVVVVFWPK